MSTDKNFFELTNPQKSVFYTQQLYPGTSILNISGTLRINQKIDFSILNDSVNLVIKENDALRTNFVLSNNEYVQTFADYEPYMSEIVDLKDETEFKIFLQKTASTPFKIDDKLLFKFILFRFPNGSGGCNIIHSHLISDGWSSTLICTKLVEYYLKLANNENITLNDCSYLSYIQDENEYISSPKYQKDKEYWESKFSSFPELASLANDSLDSKGSCQANRIEFTLNNNISDKINEFCSTYNVSPFSFFLTIYSIYISRITSLDQITVGTPVLNRKNIREKQMLGMFINTIPATIDLSKNLKILDIFNLTSKETLSIFRHQRYPYLDLLKYFREKFHTNSGLYDIIISYQNAKTKNTTSEIPYLAKWHFNGNLSEALNIHISDLDACGKFTIYYDYQINKLNDNVINSMHSRVLYMIDQILNNSEILLDDIDIVTENEKKIINNLNSNYNAKYPQKPVHKIFEEQVELTPYNTALSLNSETLSYTKLNKKANQLARFLQSKGITRNTPVALRLNKSFEMIIAILGIIKAGGCYLPIDLSYPTERVEFMLKDSNSKLLLTNTASNNLNLDCEIINLDNEEIYNFENTNLPTINELDDIIYIIYTSGSTGTPKGTMLTHRNVVRLMKNNKFLFDFTDKDVWTMFHSVAFDFSVWEIYGALLYGGKLVLVPENISRNPKSFLKLLRTEKVTVLNQTPTFFYNLEDQEIKLEDTDLKIRYIVFGGEALKPSLLNNWHKKYPSTKLINMYGITETTVHVTFKELTDKDLLFDKSNIGKPIPLLKVYILDKKLRMLPPGIEGEMCVVGDGVSKGYLNRPELNDVKFIPNPFNPTERMYRSADSAILGSDGNLYYKGRIDTQVKIRGFRIELGEIETKLLTYPKISKCVVLPEKKSDKDSHLVAYIVCNGTLKIDELKDYLKNLLPEYMIPNYFVKIPSIPLNNNGKVDRKLLQTYEYTIENEVPYAEPRNDFEINLKKSIESETGIKNIGIDDNILDLGVDSLTLMRIVARMLKYEYEISIQKFYEYKTIRKINDNFNNEFADISSLSNDIYYDFNETSPEGKFSFSNVLLTGATGFLGVHILYDLIKNTKSNVYCLIRDKNYVTAQDRLKEKIKFYFKNELIDELDKRIFIVKGDVSLPHLGLDESVYKSLGLKIDMVIHSAAIVNHFGKKEIFESVNVEGTNNVIDFCMNYKVKLNHISTISVSSDFASHQKISKPFTEKSLYIGQPYKKNIYVKTKFEAEYNIWKAMQNGLTATVYRLGNITSRYSDGKFQENDYQNAFLSRLLSFIKLGKITDSILNYSFDMSPVDFCSNSIVQMMQYQSSYGKVFHIINNNEISLNDVVSIIPDLNIKVVSNEEFYDAVVQNNDNSIGLINDITNKNVLTKNINIQSDYTLRYMHQLGIEWPTVEKKYIKRYVEKYILLGE